MMGSSSSSLNQVTTMMVCTSVLDALYCIVGFLCKKNKFHVCWQFMKFYQEKSQTELPLSTDPLLDLFSASHGYVLLI